MAKPVTQSIRAERRKRAEARQAAYDNLTLDQKLDRLKKQGFNKGREFDRLTKLKAAETEAAQKQETKAKTKKAKKAKAE